MTGNKILKSLAPVLASAAVLVLMTGLVFVGAIDTYLAKTISLASINVIIAVSLNLISGFCGQLALGHAGFMAIGAYTSAYVTMNLSLPFGLQMGLGILMAGLVTSVFGFAIGFPALRLKGDYLAIVTLGFGEIIRVILINIPALTGGASGLDGIPSFSSDRLLRPTVTMFWTLLVTILAVFLVRNLIKSSWGRAIMSVRDDEIAAKSMGVGVFAHKMFAFTLSAFIAGVGGGLYAHWTQYLVPKGFNFLKSVDFLIIVVLGGMGSVTGTVISGYVLTVLQEFLRFLKDYRLVIYPLILIFIMIYRPGGLMGKKEFDPAALLRFFRNLASRRGAGEGK